MFTFRILDLENVIYIITKILSMLHIKNQSLDEHDFIPHLVSETADISFRHTDTHGILRSDSEQGVTLSMYFCKALYNKNIFLLFFFFNFLAS